MAKGKNNTAFVVVVLAVIALGLFVGLSKSNVTGSAVNVRFYGVSNYPLGSQAGSIQTLVKVTQPTLGNMNNAGTAIDVARDIVQVADFGNSLAGAYKGDAPAPIPTGALDAVISAADYLTDKFKKDTVCLRKIGSNYGNKNEFSFVLVTELKYRQCSYYKDWLAGVARHTYYTTNGQFICRQDSDPLFAIEMGTGKTSTNTWGC